MNEVPLRLGSSETHGVPPVMEQNSIPSAQQAWDKFGVLLYCLDFCDCVNIEV